MKYSFNKKRQNFFNAGLTLVEIAASMVILAIVCSTVLVVINRSVTAAADDLLRMQAFETARENMEMLLCLKSIKESTEYGYSEKYPAIQWQNIVSTFLEPTTARLWVQAVCSAEYTDSSGEPKKIELTQWTTDLTQEQILELMKLKKDPNQPFDPNQLLDPNQLQSQQPYPDNEKKTLCGVPLSEIRQWPFEKLVEFLQKCPEALP